MGKRLIIYFYLYSLAVIYSDNSVIILSIGCDYDNILNFTTVDLSGSISSYGSSFNVGIEKDLFFTSFLFENKELSFSFSDIQTDSLAPLEFNGNSVDAVFDRYDMTILLGLNKSWIKFFGGDKPNISFDILIPFSEQFSVGLTEQSLQPLNIDFNLLGSYQFLFNPYITEFFFYIKSSFLGLNIDLRGGSLDIDSKPSLLEDKSISFMYNLKSEYLYNGSIDYSFDNLKLGVYVGGSKFVSNQKNDPFYGYRGNTLFFGMKDDLSVTIANFKLRGEIPNFNLSVYYNVFNIDGFDCFAESKAFIYGPLAYTHLDVFIPNFNIYNIGSRAEYLKHTPIGDFSLNVSYNRIFTDISEISYGSKSFIWAIFFPRLISISALKKIPIEYDHINLMKFDINHSVNITPKLLLITNISQILPFFDINNIDSSQSAIAKNINDVSKNSISGGFSFSTFIKFSL